MYTVFTCVKNSRAAFPCSRLYELLPLYPPNGTCGSAPGVSLFTCTIPAWISRANCIARPTVARFASR